MITRKRMFIACRALLIPAALRALQAVVTRMNRYGHVAIIASVDGDRMEIAQQNPGPFGSSRFVQAVRAHPKTGLLPTICRLLTGSGLESLSPRLKFLVRCGLAAVRSSWSTTK